VERESQEIAAWERHVFAQLFPDQGPPTGVATRIASERKRIESLTSRRSGDEAQSPDALRALRDVVAAIPADLRIDVQELRIEGRDLTLRGRTRDPQSAEQIGQKIDALLGWDCDPVRTDRHREAGVQFFLHGRAGSSPKPPEGEP
jgi:hypothetical protein